MCVAGVTSTIMCQDTVNIWRNGFDPIRCMSRVPLKDGKSITETFLMHIYAKLPKRCQVGKIFVLINACIMVIIKNSSIFLRVRALCHNAALNTTCPVLPRGGGGITTSSTFPQCGYGSRMTTDVTQI